MRELTEHKINPVNDKIGIKVVDEPGQGNANHHYAIEMPVNVDNPPVDILFQNGPVNEVGINGLTQEALMIICIDRLRSFQKGPYACRENGMALTHLEESLHWLHSRTVKRMTQGKEGTHII